MAESNVQEDQSEWAEGASYADYGFSSLEEFQAAAHQQQQMMMMMMGGGMYDMPNVYSRMPLPTLVEETPTYVNAKQYRRIIKRRQARSLLEKRKSIPANRKNYLHESRHAHACRRPRGPGGRFLTKVEMESVVQHQANGMSVAESVAAAVRESDALKATAAAQNMGMPPQKGSMVVPSANPAKRRVV